jgi:hypothetical protein
MTITRTNSKKKRTKKTTTGISRRLLLAVFPLALSLRAQGSYSVIAGTVFRETGHAFPGVEVSLVPDKPSKKFKSLSTRANTRGEFAFRVPAAPMDYLLSVKPDGYRPETKRVKIVGDERVEQNFLLDRAPKEKP